MSLKAKLVALHRAIANEEPAGHLIAHVEDLEREIEKLGRAVTLAHQIINYTIINREDLKDAAETLGAYR